MRLKLSPPWVTAENEIKALFGNDSEINIDYDNQNRTVTLKVDNPEKAAAISYLLPCTLYFGLVDFNITVIPSNTHEVIVPIDVPVNAELFDTAFKNNPVYAFSKTIEGIFSNKFTYVVFKNKVVQFFNDNLNDIHGNMNTLYESIARDLFNNNDAHYEHGKLEGVCYCTDIEEKVGMPLGEWP